MNRDQARHGSQSAPALDVDAPHIMVVDDDDRLRKLLRRYLISEEDCSLYKIVHSPEEGVDWIRHFYSTYHSMRQVRDKLVLRLERQLSDEHMEELNESFGGLARKGKIEKTEPLSPEADEPHLLSKPRIAFSYDGTSAGKLNLMIHKINELGASIPVQTP